MFGYYLELAIHSLRRNVILTALMVAAVGVGIGASMTVLTTLVAMAGNPIPDKSSQLFAPQLDIWGPASRAGSAAATGPDLPTQLTYRDAVALMQAHRGKHQAAMYSVAVSVSPPEGTSFHARGRATYADFFSMFDVPFRSGNAWGRKEDEDRANVVVLSSRLADRVFPHTDPVGKIINLTDRDYRVVGVIRPWIPTPHFYDLSTGAFSESEDFYLPFSTAIDRQMQTDGAATCNEIPAAGWEGTLNSSCAWIQFWLELPTAAQVRDFRTFLVSYAAEQQQLGRFHWPPNVRLHDVMDWMAYNHVVPDEVRVNVMIAIGFLIVCLVNAVGLMLAKFSSRTKELGLRRALGASRKDVFMQCVTETMVIGLVGGVLGLVLTAFGLSSLRGLLGVASQAGATARLATLDTGMVLITIAVAVAATVCSGLYPTYRASLVQPAWQLRAL